MLNGKVIPMLIFVLLALCSGVRAQNCRDGGNYTAHIFDNEVPQQPTTAQLCECVRANLERSGQLKEKKLECIESETLNLDKFVGAKDDGKGTECSSCLNGCKKVVAPNPEEDQKICALISGSGKDEPKVVARRKRGIRIRCYLVFSWRWFKVTVYLKCTVTFSIGK